MKPKDFIITLFVLSNCFIDGKSEQINMSYTQYKADNIKSSYYSLQSVSGSIINEIDDLIFSEENDTSLTEFGISVATGDFNGDFFDDLIISEIRAGRVVIYFGGEEIDTVPDLILHTEQEGSNYGTTVSSTGDINNDGFNDIMVGASHYCIGNIDYHGRVYIYYGGIQMDNLPDLIFQGRIKSAFLGTDIAKLGDVNNDGSDDIGMCELNNDTCYLYFGGADVDTIPDVLFYFNNVNEPSIHTITGAGDFNNDGISDILIGSPFYGEVMDFSDPMFPIYLEPYGRVYIYFGSENLDSIADIILEGEVRGAKLGHELPYSNGDINNDGIDDIIVGANNHVEIFYGGDQPDSIHDVSLPYISNGNDLSYVGDINNDSIGDIVLISQTNSMDDGYANIFFGGEYFDDIPDKQITFHRLSEYWGISVFDGGDINSDNHNDLIFTYRNEANGEVQVYFGGDIFDSIPDLFYRGLKHDDSYGTSVSSAGDINNDGYDDIIIGAPAYSINKGRAYIYFGGSTMDTIADVILEGNDLNTAYGKYVTGIGNINNDEYDDILISSSKSFIFTGGDTFDTIPDVTLSHDIYKSYNAGGDINNDGYDDIIASNGEQIGVLYGGLAMDSISDFIINIQHNNYSSAGDINNDGSDDIIVSNSKYSSNIGRVYIYYGGVYMDDSVDVMITGQRSKDYFGKQLSSLGDVNNDGFDDVIVAGADNCRILFGGNVVDTTAGITLDIIYDESYYHNLPCLLSHVKDINGNGIDDVLVVARDYPFVSARHDKYLAYVFYGDENIDSLPDTIFTFNPQPINNISSAGDVNGDSGYDLIIGSGLYPSSYKTASLIFGKALFKFNAQPLNVVACNIDTVNFSLASINVLKYSWEMSTDSGTTYFKLEDNDYFTGSDSSALQIISSIELSKNLFRCKVINQERYQFSNSASLYVYPHPTALFLGDSLYCMEDSVALAVELTGSSPWIYTLTNGLDSSEYIVDKSNHAFFVNNTGTYKVISLRDKHCPGIVMGGHVDVYHHPTSLLSGNGSLCVDDSVTLSIEFSGSSPWHYTLSDGLNSEELVTYESYHTFNVGNPGTYSLISLHDKNCIGLNMSGEVEVEDCSSLINTENEEITIYPNPTDGKVTINNLPNKTDIQIISTSGQTLYLSKVNDKMIEIELSFYQPGVYFLKIIMQGRMQISRIIIE